MSSPSEMVDEILVSGFSVEYLDRRFISGCCLFGPELGGVGLEIPC